MPLFVAMMEALTRGTIGAWQSLLWPQVCFATRRSPGLVTMPAWARSFSRA